VRSAASEPLPPRAHTALLGFRAAALGRRLVANAALPASGRLEDFDNAELDSALDVNLRAPVFLAQAFARPCPKARRAM